MSCSHCNGLPNCPVCSDCVQGYCSLCGGELYITNSGDYKGKDWHNLKCPECGYEIINEPDIYDYGY